MHFYVAFALARGYTMPMITIEHKELAGFLSGVSLFRQAYGAGFALGVQGSEDSVNQFCNWLFNHGITGSHAHFTTDNFAYVLIFDNPRFTRFLLVNGLGALVAKMQNDHFLLVAAETITAPYRLGEIHADEWN